MTSSPALRDLLAAARLLDEAQLAAAEAAAARAGVPLVHALHRMRLVDDRKVARLLSVRLGLERVDLDARTVHPQVLDEVAWRVAWRLRALPLGVRRAERGSVLYVAMSDPTQPGSVDELHGITGMEICTLVVEEGVLERALRRHYPDTSAPRAGEELPTLEPLDDAPPVVVGAILEDRPVIGGAPFLTDNTADALALYAPHMGPNARRPFQSQDGVAVQEGRLEEDGPTLEEHLEDDTREVLRRFAPSSDGPREIGSVGVVSPDPRVLRFVAASLAPLARVVHEAPSLARVREVMRKVPLERVVLLYPRRDVVLEGALRDLQEIFNPPRVIVVSSDSGFDDLPGVELRLSPPTEVETLPGELLRALKRVRA